MAGSINKVIILGNVGKDPEIRSFNNGGKVANFSVATSESWKDKQSGEKRERTEWHKVTVYGDGLVNVVDRYVKKGTKLYVEGKLQTRKWQDRDGNDKFTTEIVLQGFGTNLVLLGGNGSGGASGGGSYGGGSGGRSTNHSGSNETPQENFDLDDDLPF